MVDKVKLSKPVYIFVADQMGNPYIVRGIVQGAFMRPSAIGQWLYCIHTDSYGMVYRLQTEMWESVEDIKNDLENLVEC